MVLEQDLADGVAAATVVRPVVAPAAHDRVEDLDLDLGEVYRLESASGREHGDIAELQAIPDPQDGLHSAVERLASR